MRVTEVRTPSASAAPSQSILVSVRTRVAGRVNGGHRTFAVSSFIAFTKKQIFHGCSIAKHLNSFLLYKTIGMYFIFHSNNAIPYILCMWFLISSSITLVIKKPFQQVEILLPLKIYEA